MENTKQGYMLTNSLGSRWANIKECLESVSHIEDLSKLHLIISEIYKNSGVNPYSQEIFKSLNFIFPQNDKKNDDLLSTVKYIATLALRVEEYFPDGMLDILWKHTSSYTTYPSQQVACVIALGFFWCIPDGPKYADLNSPVNFLHWYTYQADVITEKMQFMLCYFAGFRKEEEQIKNSEAEPRVISFERLALPLPVSSILRYILTIL